MLKIIFLLLTLFTTTTTFASDNEAYYSDNEPSYKRYEDKRPSKERAEEYEGGAEQFEKEKNYEQAADHYEKAAYYFEKAGMFKIAHGCFSKSAQCWRKCAELKGSTNVDDPKKNYLKNADRCHALANFNYEPEVKRYEKFGNCYEAAQCLTEAAVDCREACDPVQEQYCLERFAINSEMLAKHVLNRGSIFRAAKLYKNVIMAWEEAGNPKKAQACREVIIKYCDKKALQLINEHYYAEAGDYYKEAARLSKNNDAQKYWKLALDNYNLGVEYLNKNKRVYGVANCLRGVALCLTELGNNKQDLELIRQTANRYEFEAFELLKDQNFFIAAEYYRMVGVYCQNLENPEEEKLWRNLHQFLYKKFTDSRNREQKIPIIRFLVDLFWSSEDNKTPNNKSYWLAAARTYEEVAKLKSTPADQAKGYREKAEMLRGL